MDGQSYAQKQKIVRSVPGTAETVVLEELIRDLAAARSSCLWVDDQHLALQSAEGVKIFNVVTAVGYELPTAATLLYARVLR